MNETTNSPDWETTGFTETEIEFIQRHRFEDTNKLILQSALFKDVNVKKLAAQILARQKAARKLPEWSANETLIFPPAISVEQCSSEATAKYKAGLVSGTKLTDITGGMGVDCCYMSTRFESVDYFEQQPEVARTAAYNFGILGVKNITVHQENSLTSLAASPLPCDWIYADPARRGSGQEKVVLLADCSPDIVSNLPLLFENAPALLLKTSPLLDIDLAIEQLQFVREVHIVGYEQECKELLFIMKKSGFESGVSLKSVVLDASGQPVHTLVFTRKQETECNSIFSKPLSYLYEPHAAVLKAGGFKMLGEKFGLSKIAVNSHLYTSENLVQNFPGRSFEIVGVTKPDMKAISKYLEGDKANLTIRNFPAKIHDLRKKWRLKEGGDFYLFATTLADKSKVVIVTKKAKINDTYATGTQ
jgi:hypothetical protein